MPNNFYKFIVTMVFAASGASAFADGDSTNVTGLFLEPGITYQVTGSNVDFTSGVSNSSALTRGFGVLLRGGIHVYDQIFIAADARYALLNFNDNANNISVNATSWDVAPVVGYQMRDFGARVFVEYVLAGELDPKSANGNNLSFDSPNGWRIGAGLKVYHCSVNVEWQRLHYGTSKMTRAGGSTINGITYNGEGLVASVSFPFEFN